MRRPPPEESGGGFVCMKAQDADFFLRALPNGSRMKNSDLVCCFAFRNCYIYEVSKKRRNRRMKQEQVLALYDAYADSVYRVALGYLRSIPPREAPHLPSLSAQSPSRGTAAGTPSEYGPGTAACCIRACLSSPCYHVVPFVFLFVVYRIMRRFATAIVMLHNFNLFFLRYEQQYIIIFA